MVLVLCRKSHRTYLRQQSNEQKMLRLALVLVVLSSVLSFQPEHESAVGETLQALSGITPKRTNYCNPPSSPSPVRARHPATNPQSACSGRSHILKQTNLINKQPNLILKQTNLIIKQTSARKQNKPIS